MPSPESVGRELAELADVARRVANVLRHNNATSSMRCMRLQHIAQQANAPVSQVRRALFLLEESGLVQAEAWWLKEEQ